MVGETPPPVQKIEPNSPFFLGPQDRPGDFITPTRLRGDNYDNWAGDIRTALEARRKFVFLDGTISKPEPPCTKSDWDTINAMLVSWIMNTMMRSHCKKTGHEATGCFELVGYPEWWEERGKKESGSRGGKTSGRGRGTRVNAVTSDQGNSSEPSPLLFTAEQWKALTSLMGNAKIPDQRLNGDFRKRLWIIDSGATHHVTGDVSWLRDLRKIPGRLVGLPDNKKVIGTHEGDVRLSDRIVLKNVLLVPKLNCNLISVTQLSDDMKCITQFDSHMCAIQDQSMKLIGAGVRRDGLYYFGKGDSILHVSVTGAVAALELWHRRMGHPSEKVIKLLPPVNNLRDDFSRAVWVYLLVNKTEIYQTFMSFIAMIERQFSENIKIVQSDNGTEFNCLLDYFSANGIMFQKSCVGTPQQNGRVERKHRHILNVGRALLFQSKLPISFWGEAILTAVHLINRTPSPLLNNQTPYKILFNKTPSYNTIKTFGCLCFAHNLRAKGDKFSSRSRKCIFVGYAFGKKGWRLFDHDTKEFYVSRDVKFFEDIFPFKDLSDVSQSDDLVDTWSPHSDVFIETEPCTTTPQADHDSSVGPTPNEPSSLSASSPTATLPLASPSSATAQSIEPEQPIQMGRGHRERFPSVLLKDFVAQTSAGKDPSPSNSSPQASKGTPYPIAHYINCDNFSRSYQHFISAIMSRTEPRSFKEAMQHDDWKKSMQDEIRALEDNGTWTLELLPPGKRALGCQWVYKTKYLSNGNIERLKSRLVVFGNHQEAGIDYTETFAPVAKMTTVHVFLTVAAVKHWELHQMDVHNAFLHGNLEEEVYMKLPPGFKCSNSNLVCRLRKSLYGLKQAPRCWFAKLATALKKYGFRQSYLDYSLFTYSTGKVQLNVLVYVDDLIISENNSDAISLFKSYLSDCFKMKDLGPLKYFLGIEVARSPSGVFLCQRKYTLDIVIEAGLLGAKPSACPIEQNHKLGLAEGAKMPDPEPYRRLVGRLIYLAVTRPDLAYSVHILSQFMQSPRLEHWEAAFRVVRYLKGTPGKGILLRANDDLALTGWCDSDWAACPISRRSLSGWIVYLAGSPIAWKTKKQPTVFGSSAEAEYRSMDAITWLITPAYVHTSKQLVDILTKALGKTTFDSLVDKLGIYDPHAPT
ncbi:hypothetical protein OSB04_007012 [Centaurea solstitialis]|uniref:Integrase catalytic domain-containing protein n=1 Tax=Centaurea solstitialis TaxID=347529 RepID=A0AA38U2B3_9ASTR|nr:hypothetical protein OSB04_007012 [Centaurea solstitialis]